MASRLEIVVPDVGDAEGVVVSEILVEVGDVVQAEQSLVTLESDKASMEVPSTAAGEVLELAVSVGSEVKTGDVLLTLSAQQDAPAKGASDAQAAPPPDAGSTDSAPREAAAPARAAAPYATPSVRKLARELDVDLSGLRGSGRKGRIVREDVQRLAASGRHTAAPAGSPGAIPPMPEIDFSQFGEVEQQPLTRINRLTGQNLHRSWLHVPHVTQFDDADITELEAFRKASQAAAEARGIKLTFVSFLLVAVAAALREFPRFNSSLAADGQSLILKRYVNIGVAVDTPDGLVVPVIRDVDRKRVLELAAELAAVSERARAGKLTMRDIQGGSFTLSSLGGIGGTGFTPIVNAPEVAILGVSRAAMKPLWNGREFEPRLILPLSLSYDHRVIDGAAAARFTRFLAQSLGDIRTLLL